MRIPARLVALAAVIVGVAVTRGHGDDAPPNLSPPLAGELRTAVLSAGAEVTVARDGRSVPVIRADDLAGAAFGLGFVHGEDRRFQMELTRRFVLGRLSELFGPATAPIDAQMRRHGFANVAAEIVRGLPDRHRLLLERYADGVNAALDAGAVRSVEWGLLGVEPGRWTPEDSAACVLFMFFSLSSDFEEELLRQAVERALPAELVAFLLPANSRFESPIIGGEPYEPVPVPGPGVVTFRDGRAFGPPASGWWPIAEMPLEDSFVAAPGSNAWAVSGKRTAHGGAILANDMHLPLSVPGVWYQAQMEWGGGGFGSVGDRNAAPVRPSSASGQLVGLTLPGVPGVLAGSNGFVAFGTTNLIGDVQDRVLLKLDPVDPGRYRVPGGWERAEVRVDRVTVRGADDWIVQTEVTRWGPVVGRDTRGTPFALRWTAQEPSCIDLGALDLMLAGDLDEAASLAEAANGPPLNIILADRTGRVGWAISGWLPERVGFDGSTPASWAEPGVGWAGRLAGDRRPRAIDPEPGLVWNSNNRSAGHGPMAGVGRIFAQPTRAWRVHAMLTGATDLDEHAVHAMQLDVADPLRPFYRDTVLAAFEGERVRSRDVRAALDLARGWDGDATADSRGYALLRAYHHLLQSELIGELLKPALRADPTLKVWPPRDEALRRILEERPDHLRPPGSARWDAYLRDAFTRTVRSLRRDPAHAINTPWGVRNRLAMRHPLSAAVLSVTPARLRPAVDRLTDWLDMPAVPQGGDTSTVRVARPGYGASCRLVVSPGREHAGILVLPAGQSGNPLSRHYRDRQHAWASGGTSPLLAGPTRTTLRLVGAPRE